MQKLVINLLLKAAKYVGVKKLLKLGWKHLIYPRLKSWTESNEYPDWDEKILKWVNENIEKAIDLI